MSYMLLKAENVTKKFGGTIALDNASLELKRGEIHALVGANGAGKSTLIKIITGAYSNDQGQIYLEGNKIDVKSTFEARALGISVVYQEFSLINTLTVAENIYMGKLIKKNIGPYKQIDWKAINEESQRILDTLDVDISPTTLVSELSVAQKQMIEIAKALSNEIKVLILDEPTASLSGKEIDSLFEILRGLQDKGISIIYVSHRLEELPKICDTVSVYRDGKYILTLDIEDAPKNVIIEHMAGENVKATKKVDVATDEILLEVKNFSMENKFKNINFKLRKGEILGITGLAGAGRTELVRALFGVDPKDSGEIFINGEEVKINSPVDAKKAGIGFITEDRKEEGLVLRQSIHTNVGLTILERLKTKFGLNLELEESITEDYIKQLSVKCRDQYQRAVNLSGGNQQKVVIAKWLATEPKILIMDEPTRGIDVASKNQIYDLMNELVAQGIGIIMISSELPEVIQVSNRIIILCNGQITGIIENEDISQEVLLDYATTQISKC